MKHLFNILFTISIILIAAAQGQGQDLPSACTGSVERYWVKGFNGHSDFTWTVTDPDGNIIPSSSFIPIGRGDTIQVQWNDNFIGGIYTFEVLETSDYGCNGEPYRQDIMLNSPTINIPFEGVPTTVSICYGSVATLDPGIFLNYLWQDGSTNRIYYTGESGTYQVRLIDENESCSYNEIEAKINSLPVVWLGNDTVLFGNQTLTLDVYDPDIQLYEWNTGSVMPDITVDGLSGNQTVWVQVTDINRCKNSDTVQIFAADYSNLRIPRAFTPNGDGINDKWYFPAPVESSKVDLYPYFDNVEVKVFNRWGKLVWGSEKEFQAWDGNDLNGKALPMDSYHFIIRFKVTGKTYLYKGSVTIIK